MNHFNFLTSWRENDAPSTPSLLWHWACVVEQAPPPRSPNPPEMNTTAQTQAPGSRPEPRRIREVSRMKYDLNVPTEMENIPSSVSPCPKDTGGHYAPVLMHLGKFPSLPSRPLSSQWKCKVVLHTQAFASRLGPGSETDGGGLGSRRKHLNWK